MSCNEKFYIVRDSKDNYYKFYLIDKELLLKKNDKGETILKKDILDYALDIDNNDDIHIVYFNMKGELKYSIYNDNNEEHNILTVNNKYTIGYLLLKIIDLRIHIFYRVNKFKKDVSSIYHNIFIEDNWIDEEVTKICCPEYICPYCMDYYENNIYILYCKNYISGEYGTKKFDTGKNLWEDVENNIIVEDASSINYLITPNNLEIICFSKFINNNLQVFVRFKDLSNLDKMWSSDLKVSKNNMNTYKPVAFYKDNYIYIMWKEEDRIVYRRSGDMVNWSKKVEMKIKSEDTYRALYLSNIYKNYNIKINYIYIPDIEFLISITKPKTNCFYDAISTTAITAELINNNVVSDVQIYNNNLSEAHKKINDNFMAASIKNYNKVTKYKDNYIKSLLNELTLKDLNNDYLNEVNLKLNNEINDMYRLIDKYESKLQSLRTKQIINRVKYSKSIHSYENSINVLREDKCTANLEINEMVQALLKIIEEKENIIQKLYNVIKDKI